MKSDKVLHLTLTKRWFDMILYGEKKEEYREVKPYYIVRFINSNYPIESVAEGKVIPHNFQFDIKKGHNPDDVLKAYYSKYKKFDYVQFTNGYGKDMPSMKVEFKGFSIGFPAFKWYGAKCEEPVFIISLGNVLEISNVRIPHRKLALLPGPLRRKYLQLPA